MYRLLEIGEMIMDGDEWFHGLNGEWNICTKHILKLIDNGDAPHRRKITEKTNTGNYTVNNYNKITVMGRIGNGDKKKVKKSKWKMMEEHKPIENGIYIVSFTNDCVQAATWEDGLWSSFRQNDITKSVFKWRKLPKVD